MSDGATSGVPLTSAGLSGSAGGGGTGGGRGKAGRIARDRPIETGPENDRPPWREPVKRPPGYDRSRTRQVASSCSHAAASHAVAQRKKFRDAAGLLHLQAAAGLRKENGAVARAVS